MPAERGRRKGFLARLAALPSPAPVLAPTRTHRFPLPPLAQALPRPQRRACVSSSGRKVRRRLSSPVALLALCTLHPPPSHTALSFPFLAHHGRPCWSDPPYRLLRHPDRRDPGRSDQDGALLGRRPEVRFRCRCPRRDDVGTRLTYSTGFLLIPSSKDGGQLSGPLHGRTAVRGPCVPPTSRVSTRLTGYLDTLCPLAQDKQRPAGLQKLDVPPVSLSSPGDMGLNYSLTELLRRVKSHQRSSPPFLLECHACRPTPPTMDLTRLRGFPRLYDPGR